MNIDDIDGLYYITHIDNLESICQQGILSHVRAEKLRHVSIAKQDVIDMRRKRSVPQGRPLLEYANLYFNPRNPTMYKVTDGGRSKDHLCLLKISKTILNSKNVVIADGNAASNYTRFYPSPSGLVRLNRDEIFVKYWTDENPVRQYRLKNTTCSEVLVLDCIDIGSMEDVIIPSDKNEKSIQASIGTRHLNIDKTPFFG